jgi:UDP-N-acetylglucosamine 2-epimerase (non-hydrolysing)
MSPTPNRPLRICSVIGTRPEAIKMAPVVRELARRSDVVQTVCVTAQHREMLDDVLELFGIEPDVDLDVMRRGARSLHEASAAVLLGLGALLEEEHHDWVVVQGDTTTAAVGAIAAFYAGARVAHVEAGLRTHTQREPFPEEVNRRIAGVVADLHLAPTSAARANLLREGVSPGAVVVTGNPVLDALHLARTMPLASPSALDALPTDRRLVLLTAHRRESIGAPLASICAAVEEIARRLPDVGFVVPVHPNPAVSATVRAALGSNPAVTLLDPLGYREMVELLERCEIVLTDSGGLQEEAPALGRPVLVLRDVTERSEGVEAGTVRLIGTDRRRIVDEALTLLGSPGELSLMSRKLNPYGDGRAAERIVSALLGEPVDEWMPEAPRRGALLDPRRFTGAARPSSRFVAARGRALAEPTSATEPSTLRAERP